MADMRLSAAAVQSGLVVLGDCNGIKIVQQIMLTAIDAGAPKDEVGKIAVECAVAVPSPLQATGAFVLSSLPPQYTASCG